VPASKDLSIEGSVTGSSGVKAQNENRLLRPHLKPREVISI
jgi:hypothetical protein